MFTKKTVKDINLKNKRVLLRADYNVPLQDGKIGDDYRLVMSLPTIEYLLEQGASIVIISHLGRPKGMFDSSLSLEPCAKRLAKLLDKKVDFFEDNFAKATIKHINAMKHGDITMLENLRFYPGEKDNDEKFAKQLAGFGEVFVQDAFGVSHRADASLDKVAKFLPSVSGLLLEREVDTITEAMNNPLKPLAAIMGGAKISDKIEILNRFIEIADFVAVGGAMANTFLKAQGHEVGKSLVEEDALDMAKSILEKVEKRKKRGGFSFFVPTDVVVTDAIDSKSATRVVDLAQHSFADTMHYPKQPPVAAYTVGKSEMIADIGPISAAYIAGALQQCKTVIWNGTMGVAEIPGLSGREAPFGHGSKTVLDAIERLNENIFSLIGGGDTASYVLQADKSVRSRIDHISTGGGASLDLMSGKALPAIEVLPEK